MSTTTHREALEALRADALEIFDDPECPQAVRDAIEWYHSSILAALSRPEPQAGEAVAWSYVPSAVWKETVLTNDPEKAQLAREMGCVVTPLFVHPPAGEAKLRERIEALLDLFDENNGPIWSGTVLVEKARAALSAEQKGGGQP